MFSVVGGPRRSDCLGQGTCRWSYLCLMKILLSVFLSSWGSPGTRNILDGNLLPGSTYFGISLMSSLYVFKFIDLPRTAIGLKGSLSSFEWDMISI